jgi:hypothetical protein
VLRREAEYKAEAAKNPKKRGQEPKKQSARIAS